MKSSSAPAMPASSAGSGSGVPARVEKPGAGRVSGNRSALTGRVFDIRRFSVHDGDGIRTTVFFKGCPLRCLWCHNPEGLSPEMRPAWFAGRCLRCGACAALARHGGVRLGPEGVALDPEAPEDWARILDACPTTALRWDARDLTVEEALDEILRDRVFFRHGGGVTLSGGEPLMQAAFAAALLRALRAEGVHTAMETSLYAPWADVEALLSHLDLVYCDLKLADGTRHRQMTGVSNALIRENIARLLSTNKRVVVRTPLIPGCTADEENIRQIARFLNGCRAGARYELLNYNPLAPAKYPLAGRRFALDAALAPLSPEQMARLETAARAEGTRPPLERQSQ